MSAHFYRALTLVLLSIVPVLSVSAQNVGFDEKEIFLNGNDSVFIDGNYTDTAECYQIIKSHIRDHHMTYRILLVHQPGTSYHLYIHEYNRIRQVVNDLRDEYSLSKFNRTFNQLSPSQQNLVRTYYTLNIREEQR